MFGDPPTVEGTAGDLFGVSRTLAAGEFRGLPLYQCCGTKDFLYDDNLRFRDHAQGLGLNLTYEQHEGDEHEWGYWDRQIQRVLDWLPRRREAGALRGSGF
jgi:S-formylglutathione hydrolase FrmB